MKNDISCTEILDYVPSLLIIVDNNGQIIKKNKLFEAFAKSHPSFTPEKLSQMLKHSIDEYHQFKKIVQTEFYLQTEDKANKYWFVATVSGIPLFEEAHILLKLTDVTHVHQAEQRLRDLQYAVDQAGIVLNTDTQGRIIYVNEKFCELTQYSRDELIGKTHEIVSSNYHPKSFFKDLWQTISQGQVWRGEIKNKSKNNQFHWLDTTIVPFLDDDGEPYQYMTVQFDITERKNTEKEKLELEKQRQHLQKMEAVGRLAGGIAHEFNNMLLPIVGLSDLMLQDDGINKKHKEWLSLINKSASRSAGLVRQMLDFSRDQSSEEPAEVDLPMLAKEVFKMIRSTIPSTIELRENIDITAGHVLGHASEFHQVLVNLCNNGAHAMKGQYGVLTVTVKSMVLSRAEANNYGVEAGLYIGLFVEDTGFGMSDEVKNRIFEPFYTTKAVGEGTGMGLAVVQGIIKRNQGGLTLISEEGRGTCFRIVLPLHESVNTSVPEIQAVVQNKTRGAEHIFVIDDERLVLQVCEAMLKSHGFSVTTELDPEVAIAKINENPGHYDVILTDYTMPGMTGLDLGKQVRAIKPDIPMIMITGFGDVIDKQDLENSGFKGVVSKPITSEQLALAVTEVLGTGY